MRYAVSWWLVSFAAGAVNSGAFVATEKFVSHITGTLTGAGLEEIALDGLLLIAVFILGAMASAAMLQVPLARGKKPNPQTPLWMVVSVISLAAIFGRLGLFGEMGGEFYDNADLALLSMLGFSMGLLNGSVASLTAHSVRTTHVTGPATDLGVHLATSLAVEGAERRKQLKLAFLRGAHLFFFGLGASTMPLILYRLGFLAFLVPAALIGVATVRAFRAEGLAASTAVAA